jgi:protein-L-isoaspartate O-methyltransferase
VISKAQRDRLFAVARENAVSDEQLAEIVRGVTGEASTKTIPKAEYDRIVAEVQAMQVPF